MKRIKMLSIIPIAIIYFSISWLTPWHDIALGTTISASYGFDVLFVLIVFLLNRKLNLIGKIKLSSLSFKLVFTFIFSSLCLVFIHFSAVKTPFSFVDNLFLQMIILAPLIEEFVFREGFYSLQERLSFKGNTLLLVNSILFSLSHYSGTLLIPVEFHSFIYFQMLYTFPLGWICAKSRELSGGIFEPILIHFTFNLVFYVGVTEFGL